MRRGRRRRKRRKKEKEEEMGEGEEEEKKRNCNQCIGVFKKPVSVKHATHSLLTQAQIFLLFICAC